MERRGVVGGAKREKAWVRWPALLWLCLYNLLWYLLWPWVERFIGMRRRVVCGAGYVAARLGKCLPFANLPPEAGVWIHALSVGEALSAIPMVGLLRPICNNLRCPLIFSVATESAYTLLRGKDLPVDALFVLPLDTPWIMRSYVLALKPRLFVLVEGDLWPNLLYHLRAHGTPCVLVNARMSSRAHRCYTLLARLGWNLFAPFDAVFPASLELESLYAPLVPTDRRMCVGNMKWDAVREKLSPWTARVALWDELGLSPSVPTWVAGSVHRGEEDMVLEAHRSLVRELPEALLILAPRRVHEDSHLFEEKIRRAGMTVSRRSSKDGPTPGGVYLLDTYGELMNFYGLAGAAFVGGSLIPFGGHNVLEPAVYGIPVCWGPYIANFRDLADMLVSSGRCRQISGCSDLALFLRTHLRQRKSPRMTTDDPLIPQDSPTERVVAFLNGFIRQGRACGR